MNDPIKSVKVKKGPRVFTINIYREMNPENPRQAFDNLGWMACHHRRYILGDEQLRSREDIHTWEQVEAMLIKERQAGVILPLYLYDHGGQAISTIPWQGRAPHADWDSGQVGFIYVTRPKLLEEYGIRKIIKSVRERITGYLKAEVETYNHYLQGQVYGYVIEDTDGRDVGSCWGYYEIEDAIEAAKGEIG